MLSSVDRIKEERKKAKANRNKYVGNEGGGSSGGSGGFAGSGSKYGGFGSDSYVDGEFALNDFRLGSCKQLLNFTVY